MKVAIRSVMTVWPPSFCYWMVMCAPFVGRFNFRYWFCCRCALQAECLCYFGVVSNCLFIRSLCDLRAVLWGARRVSNALIHSSLCSSWFYLIFLIPILAKESIIFKPKILSMINIFKRLIISCLPFVNMLIICFWTEVERTLGI